MNTPWVSNLGWALIHFLWQGAVIAAVYAVARIFPKNPQARYIVACAALALMIAAPVATFLRMNSSTPAPAI